MRVLSWEEFAAGRATVAGAVAISIGVFDGLHKGHRKLIELLNVREGTLPGVITFSANPSRFFHPHRYLGDIFTIEQKVSAFRELGLAFILMIDFSKEFSALSGEEFIYTIIKYMDIQYAALGANFHCGKNASTSAYKAREILEKKGIETEILSPVMENGYPVSSTGIRKAISAGDIQTAASMMGRRYEVILVPGAYELNSGKASVERAVFSQVLPLEGRYPVSLEAPGRTFLTEVECSREQIAWEQPWRNVFEKIIFI